MRNCSKMSAKNILDWIGGNQYVSIRREQTGGRIFDGKASEVMLKNEYMDLKYELEHCHLMSISAEGNAVVLGISVRYSA